MTDKIDTSQHINIRKVPLVNSNRLAKGDMNCEVNNGRISRARAIDFTTARILVLNGFLEPYHIDYGFDLMELRNALYGALDAKTSAFMFEIGDCSLKRKKAETVYHMVLKEIKPLGERIIIRACTMEYAKDNAAQLNQGALVYKMTFEQLAKVMEDIINKIKNSLHEAEEAL